LAGGGRRHPARAGSVFSTPWIHKLPQDRSGKACLFGTRPLLCRCVRTQRHARAGRSPRETPIVVVTAPLPAPALELLANAAELRLPNSDSPLHLEQLYALAGGVLRVCGHPAPRPPRPAARRAVWRLAPIHRSRSRASRGWRTPRMQRVPTGLRSRIEGSDTPLPQTVWSARRPHSYVGAGCRRDGPGGRAAITGSAGYERR
jgi:hypothetical protein